MKSSSARPGIIAALIPVTEAATRRFAFNAEVKYLPLLDSLPNDTAIYHQWPPKKLRTTLPRRMSAAIVSNDNDALVGPPIHVQTGDVLSVSLRNSLPATGLSIHWHGFEMAASPEYDGVVGITQCPVEPGATFTYEFAVDETPGTYWWHTHSGPLGVHAMNAIHGPLIVHPSGERSRSLVDSLNAGERDNSYAYHYDDERILFFSDGFLTPGSIHMEEKKGNLVPPSSKNDGGWTVGTSPWEFGTCNGRLREVVPVSAGKTFKFRLINGSSHYGLRIDVGGLKLRVVAADSEPVLPVEVDEVFLHAAERFDVEIAIPANWTEGSVFWIRADTDESEYQGYQNGIRAILIVVDKCNETITDTFEVEDPVEDVAIASSRSADYVALNCFDRKLILPTMSSKRKCIPITALSRADDTTHVSEYDNVTVHFIDSHFQPTPQFSHFVRFDDEKWYQFTNPRISMFDPSFDPMRDLHPTTNILHVPAFSTILLVWRTTALMDHPMHLHGLKMEIIDVALPDKKKDCTLVKCKLNTAFGSQIDVLKIANKLEGTAVLKDTFIIPAGGAVVTRIHTREPALWFSHCHLEMHREDGMAFILNVGNFSAQGLDLASDFPSCDSPLIQSAHYPPSCECYEDANQVMENYITSDYICGRHHLCYHKLSRAANLENYPYEGGDEIHSDYKMIGYAVSFLFVGAAVSAYVVYIGAKKAEKEVKRTAETVRRTLMVMRQRDPARRASAMTSFVSTYRDVRRSQFIPQNGPRAPGSRDIASSGNEIQAALGRKHSKYRSQNGAEARSSNNSTSNQNGSFESITRPGMKVSQQSPPNGSQDSTSNGNRNTGSPAPAGRRVGWLNNNDGGDGQSLSPIDTARKAVLRMVDIEEDDDETASTEDEEKSSFFNELKQITLEQYKAHRPLSVNIMRIFEVLVLGFLTGTLFFDVGNNPSFSGLSQRISLFFFSTTLWTFTRMYPNISLANTWFDRDDFKNREFSPVTEVLGRFAAVALLESFWPLAYVMVGFPFAGVFGSIKAAVLTGVFLSLNNLCYVSLGALFGVYFKHVHFAMIGSTIISQTTLVAAGFFTKPPVALAWLRYISPFFYTFSGILQASFKWNNTLKCLSGSSDVGANQCFLEFHFAINDYKERGIDVATFGRASSTMVYIEVCLLLALLLAMHLLILLRVWFVYYGGRERFTWCQGLCRCRQQK